MQETTRQNCPPNMPAGMAKPSLLAQLVGLAKHGLPWMFNAQRQLFCRTLKRDENGRLLAEGISHRYTAITLLGLHQSQACGVSSPIAVAPVLDALTSDLGWIESAGDLGVLLWLCAVADPQRIAQLTSRLKIEKALAQYEDGRQRSTIALALLLAALSHAKLAGISGITGLDDLAVPIYGQLRRNQGPHAIFEQVAKQRSLAGLLRGHVADLANQLYAIYALVRFGQAYGSAEAIARALDCAQAIMHFQGSKGEWWWQYDAASGQVLVPYPIYSVHQYGLAPLALFALEDAAGVDCSAAVSRGMRWVAGNNLFGFDMRDADSGIVWRSLYLDSNPAKWRELLRVPRALRRQLEVAAFSIAHECRPDELGWALYALSPKLQAAKNSLARAAGAGER